MIKIMWDHHMSQDNMEGMSYGMCKAKYVVSKFERDPRVTFKTEFEPREITSDEVELVHDTVMVDFIFRLMRNNGHGNKDQETLNTILWQIGGYVEAVREVIANSGCVFSPTSGFHHAGYSYTGGFCTFNALCLAAALNKYQNFFVIDADAHFGDGTDDIVRREIVHNLHHVSTSGVDPEKFITTIDSTLKTIDPNTIVLYQSGADRHEADSLLSGTYTTEQFMKLDEVVFKNCKERNIPIVFNLAGGYGLTGTDWEGPEMCGILGTIALHTKTVDIAANIFND